MADENLLTEDDGDDDIVIIEEEPQGEAIADDKPAAAEPPADDADADDDDERLGANEADTEEGLTPAQIKRRERKMRERMAREAQERELADLRAFRQAAEPRLAALEGNALGLNAAQLEARIIQARNTATQAEVIRERAEAAGNVSDTIEAIRLRDQANAELQQLQPALANLQQLRAQAQQVQQAPVQQPQVNSAANELAEAWKAANPWYDDNGTDANSLATKQIAAQLAREGFNGGTLGYWQELTRRCNGVVQLDTAPAQAATRQQGRKSPPTGQRGESVAPGSNSQRQFYLSPERKQAMIDMGVWDDPAQRKEWAKRYAEYDRQQAAGQ